MKIAVDAIKIITGRRVTNPESIEQLAESIAEVGLLNPITIDQDYMLIAGFHRLLAVQQLGWTEVECNICNLDSLQAELAEIDENIVRTALSVIEQGELLKRRKEIYEELHPETKATYCGGAFKGNQYSEVVSDKMSDTTKSFVRDTAEKLGKSTRTVERMIQIVEGLTSDARNVFLKYPQYDLSQSNAMKLSKLEPEKQKTAAILLASGQIHSVDEYQPENRRTKMTPKQKAREAFLENVATLKDITKAPSSTPAFSTAEFIHMLEKLLNRLGYYDDPNYEAAINELPQETLTRFRQLIDECCEKLEDFSRRLSETTEYNIT